MTSDDRTTPSFPSADDEDRAVIEPRKGKRESALPESALLVFTPYDLELLIRLFPQPPSKTHRLFLTDVLVGAFNGVPLALVGPLLGAPQAVLALEKLIALGVKRVLAFGWCGSIHPSVRIGDVVLPTEAVSEEGTSQHYPIDIDRPHPSENDLFLLKEALAAEALTVHEGPVWSVDAPYRETRRKVAALQEDGVLAVEMEASALLTVAHYRSIRLAIVLVVSDELFSLEWVHGFKDARFQEVRRMVAESVLQAGSSSL